ncbi:hypothetical protein KUF69_12125, partial [Streptomyces sp. BV129]|nr:hypothetical protein [Streptomyces sp. BV129]
MSVQSVQDRDRSGEHERRTAGEDRPAAGTDRAGAGGRSKGLNGHMLMAAVVSAISGLLYGYDTGIISGA